MVATAQGGGRMGLPLLHTATCQVDLDLTGPNPSTGTTGLVPTMSLNAAMHPDLMLGSGPTGLGYISINFYKKWSRRIT